MRTLLFIPLFLLLSCSDERKAPVIINKENKEQITIDSFIIKKIFARARHIDSLAKIKKYKTTDYSYETYKIKKLNCTGYRFSWTFKPKDLHIYSIYIYMVLSPDISFGEEHYYYNKRSFFFTDPDGNTGLMDFGLRTYYSYSLHSFTRSRFSLHTYIASNVGAMFEEKKINPFDNIMAWDSLYDAQHPK